MFKKFRNSYHQASEWAHHHTIVFALGLFIFSFVFAWQILMPQGQASANFYEGWCLDNQGDITIPLSECQALEQFYIDANLQNTSLGSSSSRQAWFSNPQICNNYGGGWNGVGCNTDLTHVSSLSASYYGLSGSADLRDLTELRSLNLQGNNIHTILISGLALTQLSLGGNGSIQHSLFVDTAIDSIQTLTLLDLRYVSTGFIDAIDFSLLPNLNSLAMMSIGLDTLQLPYMSGLTSLYLDYNNLSSIDLSLFPNLQNLGLSYNNFSSLYLTAVSSLQNLNISNNNLTSLDLTVVPNLIYLSINNNNLTSLDLSNRTFYSVQAAENNLQTLILDGLQMNGSLDLRNNNLSSLDFSITSGGSMMYLYIGGNPLNYVDLSGFNNLQYLSLSSNRGWTLDPTVTFVNHQGPWLYLYIYGTKLQSVPDGLLEQFPLLTRIDLGGNDITDISNIESTSMTHINLYQNFLQTLPEDIDQRFPSLDTLDVSYNRLTDLPQSLLNLPALNLNATYNCLQQELFSPDMIMLLDNSSWNSRSSTQNNCQVTYVYIAGNWLNSDGTRFSNTHYFTQGTELYFDINVGSRYQRYNIPALESGVALPAYELPTTTNIPQDGNYTVTFYANDYTYTIEYVQDNGGGGQSPVITKQVSTGMVNTGDIITYTVTVPFINIGASAGKDVDPVVTIRDYLPAGLTILDGQITISGSNISGYIDSNYDMYGMIYGQSGDICAADIYNKTGLYADALNIRAVNAGAWIGQSFVGFEDFLAFILDNDPDFAGLSSEEKQAIIDDRGTFLLDTVAVEQGGLKVFFDGLGIDITTIDESCGVYDLIAEDVLQYKTTKTLYTTEQDMCYVEFADTGSGAYRHILETISDALPETYPAIVGGNIADAYYDLQAIYNNYNGGSYDLTSLEDLLVMLEDLLNSDGALLDSNQFVTDILDLIDLLLQEWDADQEFNQHVSLLDELQADIFIGSSIDEVETPEELFGLLAGYDGEVPLHTWLIDGFCPQALDAENLFVCLNMLFYVVDFPFPDMQTQYPSCGEAVASDPYWELASIVGLAEGQSLIWTYTVRVDDGQPGQLLQNNIDVSIFTLAPIAQNISADVWVYDPTGDTGGGDDGDTGGGDDGDTGGGTGGSGGTGGGSSGGGGGGGGAAPILQTDVQKNICEIRDCSDSYYDGECGVCDQEHNAADEQPAQASTNTLLIDDKIAFLRAVQQRMAQLSCDMSTELTEAYVFAHDVGITTVPDLCQADMYGGLIRKHMAKFMVMFATQILGKSPDTSIACDFDDMANETLEFRGFARMACQLGIMGVKSDGTPATSFNPDGQVTRAQFGTALSRVLRGSTYNTASGLRYQLHLQALQANSIMNQISNPDILEVRGYVMLMLMRAYLGL